MQCFNYIDTSWFVLTPNFIIAMTRQSGWVVRNACRQWSRCVLSALQSCNIWTSPPTQCHSHCVDPLLFLFPRPVLNASRQPTLLIFGPTIVSESDCCRQTISASMKSVHYAESQHSSTFQLKNPSTTSCRRHRSNWPSNCWGCSRCFVTRWTQRSAWSLQNVLHWRQLHLCMYVIFMYVY